MRDAIPRFMNGVFAFRGAGLDVPQRLDAALAYRVPADRHAQLTYLRAGNSSDELACITLMRDGAVLRLFPVGAKAASHVSLSVVEDLPPETEIVVYASAPHGVATTLVLDIGLMEI